jgi:hypothetical protein
MGSFKRIAAMATLDPRQHEFARAGLEETAQYSPECGFEATVEPGELRGAGEGLVGSFVWTLNRGERWILGPEAAFLFKHCWRKTLVREAYMLDLPTTRQQMWKDALKTVARRWITGEPFLLDLYIAERDGAELGISSDEIGGALYAVAMEDGALISRKSVYFGSQADLLLRVTSPLQSLRRGMGLREIAEVLKRTAYGPGWVFQRFVGREGGDGRTIILQIDGDIYHRELAAGETIRTDPRHVYAWDESVSFRLVKFGNVGDRLLRGSVPFQTEFQGPGRLWLSNVSFGDGYLGSIFTPSHWVFRLHMAARKILGFLNPATWL